MQAPKRVTPGQICNPNVTLDPIALHALSKSQCKKKNTFYLKKTPVKENPALKTRDGNIL